MTQPEAVEWIRRGVTPKWISWVSMPIWRPAIDRHGGWPDFENTALVISKKDIEALADRWGIEAGGCK